MKTVSQLNENLTNLNRAISKLESKFSGYGGHNPAGDFGGIRSESRRTKEKRMDASIDCAVELVRLKEKRKHIEAEIRFIETTDKRELYNLVRDCARLMGFKQLKVGDMFQPGNNPLTITKKNKLSIVAGNCNWSILEVAGITPKRVKEIEERLSFIETREDLIEFYKEEKGKPNENKAE